MPLDSTDFYPRGPVKSIDIRQFYDLFTGVMVDQPVTFRNVLTIGGNQGITTVPLKLYGAPGQNTNLLDLYPDRSSSQPGFGIGAGGEFAWGPGGTAPQDTHMSRLDHQLGHEDDAAGLFITPRLEVDGGVHATQDSSFGANVTVTGALTAGTLQVTGGGLGTIGATRINFSPTAYIQALATDTSFIELPKLTVLGQTNVGALTVTGAVNINGATSFTAAVNTSLDLTVGRDLIVGRNTSMAGTLGVTGAAHLLTTLTIDQRLVVAGYDAGGAWPTSLGGNAIAQGRFYQRANGSFYCWDAGDFVPGVGIAANTVVQRDGSGQIQAQAVYMPSANQPGKPTSVLGQTGDGWTRWWPTNAIGPPISAWYTISNITLPALSSSGGTANATFSAVANQGGFTVSGQTITVPRPGWYAVAGGFNGQNNTGNSETMDVQLIGSVHGVLDTCNVPIKISSFLGGFFTFEGFLNQGETLRLQFHTLFDAISGSGEILVSFVPTADYNQ